MDDLKTILMVEELQKLNPKMPQQLIVDLVNLYEQLDDKQKEIFEETMTQEGKPIEKIENRIHDDAIETQNFETKEESDNYMKNKYQDIITEE